MFVGGQLCNQIISVEIGDPSRKIRQIDCILPSVSGDSAKVEILPMPSKKLCCAGKLLFKSGSVGSLASQTVSTQGVPVIIFGQNFGNRRGARVTHSDYILHERDAPSLGLYGLTNLNTVPRVAGE